MKAQSDYSREAYLLSDGRAPEEWFREVCVFFSLVLAVATVGGRLVWFLSYLRFLPSRVCM